MSEVPSVNPTENTDIPDSEGATSGWVDPIFIDQNPDRMSDEPEPTPEEIKAREAEEAAAEQVEREAKGEGSPDQLKALIEENPDDEDDDETEDGKVAGKTGDENAEEANKGEEAEDSDSDEEGDESDDAEEGETSDKPKKPRRRSRARRERRAMERKMREMEAEITALKEAPGATTDTGAEKGAEEAPPAEEATPQPQLEDFDFDTAKWAEALGDWTKQLVNAGEAKAAKAEEAKAEEAAEKVRQQKLEAIREHEEKARDKHEDYDDLVYDPTIFIPDAAVNLMEPERVPELVYYLAAHQDEALELKDMSEVAVARALGRIEAKLASATEQQDGPETNDAEEAEAAEEAPETPEPAAKTPRRTPTRAPDPIKTVSGGAAGGRDPSKMSMAEYKAGRMSGKIK